MADKKLTIEDFAKAIKQRAPELADVPDAELVRKVLERRPEMRNFLVTEMPRPSLDMSERVEKRLKGAVPSTMQALQDAINRRTEEGKEAFKAKRYGEWAGKPLQLGGDIAGGALSGLWNITGPGIAKRLYVDKEDPANVIGDALMTFPFGETPPASAVGETVRKIGSKTMGSPIRIMSQELAGAGKEPVFKARMAYQDALREWREATGTKQREYFTKVKEAEQAYQSAINKSRADWVENAAKSRRAEAESSRLQSTRSSLERGQETYADQFRQNLKSTFQTVKGRLDGRWDSLRKTAKTDSGVPSILKDELLNSKRIADAIDIAERKYLQGAPESVKQFRDLMNWMKAEGAQQVGEEGGGKSQRLRPITWDEARTHYSALGDRQFSGDLPGNVRQAINFVRREGLGTELQAGANRFGVGANYTDLLKDWSNYESDWLDTSSVTRKGGSPLAIALKAPNAATLIPQVTGKTGDLLMQRLGRYREAGASMGLPEGIRKLNTDMEQLPKSVSVPKMPRPLQTEPFQQPSPPKYPAPPERVDPMALRRSKLLDFAGRRVGWWERAFPPLAAERMMFKSPWFREWVASMPRKELPLPREASTPTPSPNLFQGAPVAPRGPFPGAPRPPMAPEPLSEMIRRRGPGEPPGTNPAAAAAQADLVRNLRAMWERQRASGDPAMWATGSKLMEAEAALKELDRRQMEAAGYGKPAQGFTSGGQGGANYTPEQLAQYKKKWGIQ